MLILFLLCLPAIVARKTIFRRPLTVPYASAFAFVIFVICVAIFHTIMLSAASTATRLSACLLPIFPPLFSFFTLAPPNALRRPEAGKTAPPPAVHRDRPVKPASPFAIKCHRQLCEWVPYHQAVAGVWCLIIFVWTFSYFVWRFYYIFGGDSYMVGVTLLGLILAGCVFHLQADYQPAPPGRMHSIVVPLIYGYFIIGIANPVISLAVKSLA